MRVKRSTPTFPDVDMSKPVNKKEIMSQIDSEDCFSREWHPEDKLCSMCADMELCGILFHARQNKRVKQLEKEEGGFLDTTDFEAIDKDSLFGWLSAKSRTTQQLFDQIKLMSNCPDDDTVKYWMKSFIVSHPKLATKGGVVVIKD